jgi:RNA polymerase sigma-70 factor (ECF subfamily)
MATTKRPTRGEPHSPPAGARPVTVDVDAGDSIAIAQSAPDPDSLRWLERLRSEGTRREESIAELHSLLLRAARHETRRRRGWLGGAAGPELDDLAHQAAADALVAVVDKLDTYRGASRFTTWAYKFVFNQVSLKMRRHIWSGRRVEFDNADWEGLPSRLASPEAGSEQQAQLAVLQRAVEEGLTERQRDVFVAVALNETPIDVVADRLNSNRGAIYKMLHDARMRLRTQLADAGHPLESDERER